MPIKGKGKAQAPDNDKLYGWMVESCRASRMICRSLYLIPREIASFHWLIKDCAKRSGQVLK